MLPTYLSSTVYVSVSDSCARCSLTYLYSTVCVLVRDSCPRCSPLTSLPENVSRSVTLGPDATFITYPLRFVFWPVIHVLDALRFVFWSVIHVLDALRFVFWSVIHVLDALRFVFWSPIHALDVP